MNNTADFHDELLKENEILRKENESLKAIYEKDISTPLRTEKALIDSEIRYRRLFETAKDGIIILNAKTGMIIDVNPFLIDLLGYPYEEFIEKKIWEISCFQNTASNKEKFEELQRKGYIRYEDLPLETSDGRQINVEFVSNVYLENKQKVIQCNIRDITKRRLLEMSIFKSEIKYRNLYEKVCIELKSKNSEEK